MQPTQCRFSLKDGVDLQRSGDLAGAEAIYDTVLEANPRDDMATTLLGSVWCETDRFENGISLIHRAIATSDYAVSHFILAQAMAGRGRMAEAASAFRRSIELQPSVLAAHVGLGQVLARLGDYKGAADAYLDALRLDPSDPEPYRCTGVLLHQLGRPKDGLAHLEEAARLGPDRVEVWAALGNAYLALRQYKDAAIAFRKEVALAPASATAHLHLGDARYGDGDHSNARDCYERAIELAPNLVIAHLHLGNVLYDLRLFEDAAAAVRMALALEPNHADAFCNLGNALLALGLYDEAEAAFRDAIRLQPDRAAYHSNLGTVLTAQRKVADALDAQQQALLIDPGFVDARYNHAITLLLDGQFDPGWKLYEARWELPWNPPRDFSQPRWTGEALAGRTILLHAEQGLGDMLQMARYVPLVAASGGRVIVEVHAPLVRLFQDLPGVEHVVPFGTELPPFDLQCPLFSLPLVFGARLDTIPAAPYLSVEPSPAASALFRPGSGLRVGLVWSGDDKIGPRVNRERSIGLTQLASLAHIPGVDPYSLQKDPDPEAARAAEALGIIDLMAGVTDFADTAALVAHLDLVISVDTSTAHLAAAMGKPVWLLSRYSGCWRWLMKGMDSPWYPSLRIYRQSLSRDWTMVIDQVVKDLTRIGAKV
jgi:tetratricopeptide (TPR) repeat protein